MLTNIKKDSVTRKTKEYAEVRLSKLNEVWQKAVENDTNILEYGDDDHAYFKTESFNKMEILVEQIKNELDNILSNAIEQEVEAESKKERNDLAIRQISLITIIKGKMGRIQDRFETEISITYIQENLKSLKEAWNEINENHIELLSKGEQSLEYFTKKIFEETEIMYEEIVINLQEKLKDKGKTQENVPKQNKYNKETNLQLPKIEIPKFSGSYYNWKAFRDLFKELIEDNESLGKTQKFHYLKSNLNNEPFELIKHLPVTAENYDTAWQLLDKRYNNTRLLAAHQLKNLFNQPNILKESARAIKKLHDITIESLLAIENLQISVENWDPLLIYLLVEKLDKESHRLYEQSLSSPREMQTLKHFFEFLENRFQTLESLEGKTTNQPEQKLKTYFGSSTKQKCLVCHQDHKIYQCERFKAYNEQQKIEYVIKHKLCKNCLMPGHFTINCKSSFLCKICGKRHHTTLHRDNNINNKPRILKEEDNRVQISTHYSSNSSYCSKKLLATAIVEIQRKDGSYINLRALIDPCSEATLITENKAQQLQLKKYKTSASISGVGKSKSNIAQHMVEINLRSRFEPKTYIREQAFILSNLTSYLPSENITSYGTWEHINGLTLADPYFYQSKPIDIILGASVYGQIILNHVIKGKRGTPIAQKTELGYILTGEIMTEKSANSIKCHVTEIDIGKELSKFWESEELSPEKVSSTEELECEVHFKSTCQRQKDGRYVVRIPFREHFSLDEIQGSRELALARLFQLERKFKTNKLLETMYKDFITEYIQLGHMVPVHEKIEGKYYLPHHAVFKHDSSTTKLRVVFDASAKRNSSKSLNDVTMIGENLQQNITELLIRWRKYKVVFTADIEKMYRQIRIDNRDQEFQRILWRNSPNEPIKEYKLTTVTYGTGPAPFLAIRTLRQLVADDGHLYPLAAKAICKDTYMDDVVSGAYTYEEASLKCTQLINLLKAGGFNLRKWNCSDRRLLKQIPPELRDCADNKNFDDGEAVKALGIHWVPKTDKLKFNINTEINLEVFTKRSILSEAARIFDPIGLLSPIIIKIKLLFQQIWLEETDWDQPVSNNILKEWLQIKEELPSLRKIEICRWIDYGNDTKVCQLHGFSDASEKAYGAVVYLRTIANGGNITVTLIASKTKVAPLRSQLSLPRLELSGALLLARLMKEVKNALDLQGIETFAWTDSTIVLSWLEAAPHRWKTFVGNRIAEIQAIIGPENWYHVNSSSNPADLASRGIYPSKLENNTLWWEGPTWLKQKEFKVSKNPIRNTKLEIKTKFAVNIAKTEVDNSLMENLLHKYSSITKLQRVLAYCKRFISNLRLRKEERNTQNLTTTEIKAANLHLVQTTQIQYFKNEIECLVNQTPMQKNSSLLNLNPFLDENNVLRVGGRITEFETSYNRKHPYILPYKSILTDLIINWAHKRTLHGGNSKTLEYIRQNYWILNGLKAVKGQIHRCTVCHRFKTSTTTQLMGNLPKSRLTVARPFTNCGVDYAGPFTLRASVGRGTTTFKGYIALFVCFSTKAIHIEVVTSLTSIAFLAAFKRFISRRGPVSNLYSDNGTNFTGASKILTDTFNKTLYQNEIADALCNNGTQWHFIPPNSPHFGGLWEAGVKSTKYHLKRIIKDRVLTYEELNTLMTKIEACLNSRPLCPLNNDPESLEVLTPGHFLIGGPLLSVPEEDVSSNNINYLKRWQLLDHMHQNFWKRWSKEYISRLQFRPKWKQEQPNLQKGNIVIIKEDNLPATKWALGRIIDTTQDANGLVRVVTLKTKGSVIKRAITKVSLLPIVDNEREIINTEEEKLNAQNSSEACTDSRSVPHQQRAKRKGREENARNCKETKRAKHIKTNYVSSILLTIIFSFLWVLVLGDNKESVNYYTDISFSDKQGIYFEKIADTDIYSSEWTLLVHFNLTPYYHQIEGIKTSINYLKDVCDKYAVDVEFEEYCIPIISQLRHQYLEIENANTLIAHQNKLTGKQKRAALGIVGSIAHSLFGVLDEEYAEKYEAQLADLKENENNLVNLLRNQTSIADSTINLMKREQKQNTQQFLNIKKQLSVLSDEINRTKQHQNIFGKFNSAVLLITLDLNSIRHIQQAILGAISDIHHGKISTLLLTPSQLSIQLKIIRDHIPRNLRIPGDQSENQILTLYSLMQAKTRVTTNNILFEIKIPLLDAEYYKIYQLIPIPMNNSKQFVYVEPSSKYLLVNTHRDRYTPMENADLTFCRHWKSDNLLCKFNLPLYGLRSNVSKCEMELLNMENNLSPFCKIKGYTMNTKWIRMNAANHWIYILPKTTTFDLSCGNNLQKLTLSGNGIIQLQPTCFLKHSSMFLSANSIFTGNISSSFLVETNIPRNISTSIQNFNISTHLPVVQNEITDTEFQAVHSMIAEQRNQLSNLKNSSFHHIHHYTVAYLLLTIVIMLAVLYCYRNTRSVNLKKEKVTELRVITEKPENSNSTNHPFGY